MSVLYPFCTVADSEKWRQQRPTTTTSTKPTTAQSNLFLDEIAEHLISVCNDSGYDVDNFHEVSATVSAALTSGDDKSVTLSDGSDFSAGEEIKIDGLTSGVKAYEFTDIEAISGDIITVDLANSYDASSVTVYVLNGALRTLRRLNAIGGASMIEKSLHMGASPNRSEWAQELYEMYLGSEETQDGIWAIRNIENFLMGATVTTEAPEKKYIQSYGSENSTDTDVEPKFEIDMDF